MDKESVRLASESEAIDYSAIEAVRGPVECSQCGYRLHGLAIEGAVVECPECGFPQALISYNVKSAHFAIDSVSNGVAWGIIGLLVALFAISLFQILF